MQLNALNVNNNSGKKRKADVPKTLVMRLNEIVNEPNKPAFFHGIDVDTNEPVSVRLMNVDEGAMANRRQDETLEDAKARISNQYIGTDAKHRPRPSEFRTPGNKVHCGQGGLLIFTKAVKNPDGTFRAHWAETLDSKPGTECQKVMAHISVGEIKDKENPEKVTASFVNADIIKPEAASILTSQNAQDVLMSAFANHDGVARRNPFVLARLAYSTDGHIINELPEIRVAAAMIEEEIIDYDNGVNRKVRRVGTPDQTLAKIMDPENMVRGDQILRSVVYGLSGADGYPDFTKVTDDSLRGDLHAIVDAIRDGSVVAEVIPGERITAGKATKASFLKQATNAKHPLHQYKGQQYLPTVEDGQEVRKPRNVKYFFETYLTTKVEADLDYRYFTKAVPAEMFPTRSSGYTVATANDFSATAEASKQRAEEAASPLVDASAESWDPEALAGDGIDEQLARSAESVEMTM